MKRPAVKNKARAASCLRSFHDEWAACVGRIAGAAWPSAEYIDDPVGFVREKLGENPLPHQIEILEAARDNFKTAVRSGQKTGKTKLVVWLALWWYCTRPKARVFMIAAIKEQVQRVLWVELQATLRAAAPAGFELQERVPLNPSTGVISADGREIRGFTVRDIEAMAGLSGDILFIVDEASHLSEPIAQAIEGNLAGDGRMIWISNPTQTAGPFYEAFNNPDRAKFWKLFHLSSETVARYCAEHGISHKGVASLARIEEWAREYGKDSPFYVMRVLGEFLKNETGRIITVGDIDLAQKAWEAASDSEGPLTIGVDPAGPGHGGDEYGFCVVRGLKMLWLEARLGVKEDDAIEHIRSLLKIYRRGDEIPWIIADVEGPIGSSLGGRLRGMGEALRHKRPADAFEFLGVKASHNARREPLQYERVREELWAQAAKWLRAGGAILPDHKLATELHAPMWLGTVGGKLKVTPKDELREILGRSTDRADAFLMAVWPPTSFAREDVAEELPSAVGAMPVRQNGGGPMNPYADGFAGSRSGGIDPYG